MNLRIKKSADPPAEAVAPAAPPGRVTRSPGAFTSLANSNYRRYWVGLVLYVLGHRAEYVTYAWMVWELTEDPLYLGYLGLAQGAPFIILALGGGVLADRTDRLRLLRV